LHRILSLTLGYLPDSASRAHQGNHSAKPRNTLQATPLSSSRLAIHLYWAMHRLLLFQRLSRHRGYCQHRANRIAAQQNINKPTVLIPTPIHLKAHCSFVAVEDWTCSALAAVGFERAFAGIGRGSLLDRPVVVAADASGRARNGIEAWVESLLSSPGV